MNNGETLRAYLVNDEMLALKRLAKLLSSIESIEIVGSVYLIISSNIDQE